MKRNNNNNIDNIENKRIIILIKKVQNIIRNKPRARDARARIHKQ